MLDENKNSDTQPINIGEFDDFVDAMVERDALRIRVESLEAALGDIALSAAQTNTMLVRGMLCIADIQKFIARVGTIANNARRIGPRTDQNGGNLP